MDRILVGNFLAELRNEKKLTQEQLAEHLNVSSKTISKWECGNSMPDLETLVELAEFYNVSLYELTKGKRIKNVLISKKDLHKVINKKTLTKIMIIKILSLIILMVIFIVMLISTIYTFNNYNQFKIYEMISADNDFYIDGMVVKNRDRYYLAISSIDYEKEDKEFLDDKTMQLKYYIMYKKKVIGEKCLKNFDKYKTIGDAMTSVRFYISDEPIKGNLNKIDLYIEYTKDNNEIVKKNFKIILIKKYSNDKVFY